MATLVAVFKFTQFLFWCAVLIPPQMLVIMFSKGKAVYVLPQLWHKMICLAFGLKVETSGKPVTDRQVLYVSNHISYLDIPVVTAILPASFVAKAEVAGWPLFGLLAKLQQTAFVDRSRHKTRQERDNLKNTLKNGKSLIMFPEGTSSDGARVLPFKSSLFSIALEAEGPQPHDVVIQPFTIELVESAGKPVTGQKDRDLYAWYGDMTLMPHFWNFAKSKGAKVKLHFHPPIQVKGEANRKELARICYEAVASGLEQKIAAAA